MTGVRIAVLAALLGVGAPAWAAPAPPARDKDATPAADAPRKRVAEPPDDRDEGKPPPDDSAKPPPGDEAKPPPEGSKPPPDGTSTPKEMTPPIKKKNLSHRYQVSVDIAVAVGAAFRVTYEDTTWCGKGDPLPENDSFCTGLAPVSMDFGLGFSVLHALEILVEFRVGAMKDTLDNRPLMLMPGLRLWIDPKLPFKIGLAFQMVIDFTKQKGSEQQDNLPPKGQDMDLGMRFYTQFQYDFLRYVGIFARIGLLGTFQKWIGINLEGSLGVQARFP